MYEAPDERVGAGKQGHGVLSDEESHGPDTLRGEGRPARTRGAQRP